MRDGYAGYRHLTGALHAWCGAHLLRDLKDIYDFEPARQAWASDMASILVQANERACQACQAGRDRLDEDVLAGLLERYRALAAAGLDGNKNRHTRAARDARRVARRFRDYEDLILRFVTDLAVTEFTNNEAERSVRPVKVQQRSSGGCWRTLEGLAEIRHRAVLPVHRRQMGHRRPRRPAPAVHHRALAPACPHTRRRQRGVTAVAGPPTG
jgi:transposase